MRWTPAGGKREIPSLAEVRDYLRERRNWGRWGVHDERGTANLITPERRVAAARLVRTGRTVSMGRALATTPGPGNTQPALHFWTAGPWPHQGGHAGDFFGLHTHGVTTTHLDALCHIWDEHGTWNGRAPEEVVDIHGAHFATIEAWRDGLVGRGVMLDVPRHRGVPFVTQEEPVHGWELEDIAAERGLELEPGDVVCVYSGREAWQQAHPDRPYGRWIGPSGENAKPGLHASCLPFLREHDVGVLVWDMLDLWPTGYELPWTVHGAIHSFGLVLLDNALLEPLAAACAAEGTDTFLFTTAPLVLGRGTASPVNPVAVF